MDDLILAGALSIIGLYAVAVLAVAVFIYVLAELCGATVAGNSGQVVMILAIILLFIALYSGTGVWLQKTGRI
jgi:apolipoprotein N-acyltransferase